MVLSEGRTLYEEALVYHLRDALAAYLTGESNRPEPFAHRWNVLCGAAARTGEAGTTVTHSRGLFFDLYSGSRAGLLHENWLALGLRAAGGRSDFTGPSQSTVARRLLGGIESLLRDHTGDMTAFICEVRKNISGQSDDHSIDLHCLALLAESNNQAEKWREALDLLKESDRYPDDAHDRFAIERFHWAKGVALRHLGRIREAQTELHLVFTSQLDTNPSLAITTLPSLVETMRECGDFAEGLAFLEETAKRANDSVMAREQLR